MWGFANGDSMLMHLFFNSCCSDSLLTLCRSDYLLNTWINSNLGHLEIVRGNPLEIQYTAFGCKSTSFCCPRAKISRSHDLPRICFSFHISLNEKFHFDFVLSRCSYRSCDKSKPVELMAAMADCLCSCQRCNLTYFYGPHIKPVELKLNSQLMKWSDISAFKMAKVAVCS
jgi:hypothetical protein